MSKMFSIRVIIRVIPRTPVQNFMTKYGTDIYKNMYICKNRSQDIQKWPPAEGRHDVKRFLSVVTIKIIPRTPVQSFIRKY